VVGKIIDRRKVAKHFDLTITDGSPNFTRNHAATAEEAALDSFYVLRTGAPAGAINTDNTVRAYKSIARVERAFRCLKTTNLDIRPDLPLGEATCASPGVPVHARLS
jgi:hypothetical protein